VFIRVHLWFHPRPMNPFADKVAIVTGGASGIGRALGAELVGRGARVVLADVDGGGAEQAARAMSAAGAATLDVTDAAAVERVVNETAERHGRIDYMFNNAGIATLGNARHMTLDDWNRLIEVNIRGVVHGVAAAYPRMIRQGFGHIVNTASVAGLVPTPGGAGYALTKHAVVGLSVSLREEAAALGVKVSVVCPGFIDTPLKDTARLLGAEKEVVLASLPVKLYPAEACARDALRGVERNRAVIVVTAPAKIGWLFYRLAPGLFARIMRREVAKNPLLTGAR
jgi:NAD(P)-dependent dehydrogenase (short-subunit alcohol dehydrogenase family)